MILLSIAECVFVGLFFIPNTVEMIKKLLDLPESVPILSMSHF